jgi:CxxC motif-containing protein (DUF1111 family)
MRSILLTLLLLVFVTNSSFALSDKAKLGGDLTVDNSSLDAFAKPSPTLPIEDLRKFTFGNKMFNTNWVSAPASVTSLDGLGPLFNRNSCSGCHTKDGRGRPPIKGEEGAANLSILFRLSVLDKNGKAVPHPVYGDQLNPQAVGNVLPEGQVEISYEEITEKFPDGSKIELRNPQYKFTNMNYGDLGSNFMFSPRVAPAVMGLGLLEAIPEKSILANVDVNDKNNDGISGRANYVFDQTFKKNRLGRFGWKSNQPSIKQQNAGAALGDMGITTSLNPNENCNQGQDDCKKQISGGRPEMNDYQLDRLNFYVSTLAVPARRDVENEDVLKGEEIFNQVNCSSCHTPTFRTGEHKIKVLSDQVIHPYSDLLLHDMGDALADNRSDNLANGKEWRTPPLWGIGLVKTVNHHTNFLHDGRARNFEEAILWHGGEAQKSKEAYKNLLKSERQQLIKFLESL